MAKKRIEGYEMDRLKAVYLLISMNQQDRMVEMKVQTTTLDYLMEKTDFVRGALMMLDRWKEDHLLSGSLMDVETGIRSRTSMDQVRSHFGSPRESMMLVASTLASWMAHVNNMIESIIFSGRCVAEVK